MNALLAALAMLCASPSVIPADRPRRALPPARPTAAVTAGRPVGGLTAGRASAASSFTSSCSRTARRRRPGPGSASRRRNRLPDSNDGAGRSVRGRAGRASDSRRPLPLWGQPLGKNQLASFSSKRAVRVYVAGRRRPAARRPVPLTRDAEIVLELGGYVAPHLSSSSPKGLSDDQGCEAPVPRRSRSSRRARRGRLRRLRHRVGARSGRRSPLTTRGFPGTSKPLVAGKPAKVSFVIRQPNGKPLTTSRPARDRTPAST